MGNMCSDLFKHACGYSMEQSTNDFTKVFL